ncbi:MAG: hypothetical protein Q9162_006478 [Coniocarpon cinnabarinum]
MFTSTTLLLAIARLSTAIPAPQAPAPATCDAAPPVPSSFQLAAVPVNANYSIIALSSTGGGSGLVVIPTSDDTFTGAANFTYDAASLTISTTGESNTSTTVYTSLPLQDSQSLSLTATPADPPASGLLQVTGDGVPAADGTCDDVAYFVKQDEAAIGLYGWTLCNNGALGWVGTSTAEPCEKVALRAFVNTTADASSELVSARRVMGL